MNGSMVSFSGNGSEYQGYLSPASGGGKGVIVIQEWWGLVGHIMSVADRFAAAGFTALAPDFYQGQIAEEPDTAGKLMMALNIEEAEKVLNGAVKRLIEDPACTSERVGVVGFCMGGQLSLFAASLNPEIGACVDFYGIHPNVHPDFENLQAPVLGFFASRDTYADPASVSALSEILSAHSCEHEFHTYEADHAFFNDDRPAVFDAAAAQDAWDRMIRFFGDRL